MIEYFEPVLPGEKNVLTFNMAPGLLNGNTLTGTPTITVTTYSGTDPDPSAILNGAAQIDSTNTKVLVPFYAQVDHTQYLVKASCATEQSTISLETQGILPVSST